MSDDRQTISGAYQKIEAHEDLCAVRYAAIENSLTDLKQAVAGHNKAAWGIVLALLGWMAIQVWDGRAGVPASRSGPVAEARAAQ